MLLGQMGIVGLGFEGEKQLKPATLVGQNGDV